MSDIKLCDATVEELTAELIKRLPKQYMEVGEMVLNANQDFDDGNISQQEFDDILYVGAKESLENNRQLLEKLSKRKDGIDEDFD